MVELSIDVKIPEIHDRLNKLARKQIPFATALALTWTVNDARDEVKAGLPDRFVIRSKWLERGIRTIPATKKNLEATVYSRDEFMVRQEHGGTRKPRKKYLALPAAIRKNPKQRITPSMRPAKVLKRPKAFVQPMPGDPTVMGIFERQGRWRHPLRLLYMLFPREVKINARFGMEKTVNEVTQRRFNRNFGRALARAIASAK